MTQDPEVMYLGTSTPRNMSLIYSCGNYWSLDSQEAEGDSIEFFVFSDFIAASWISASSIMAFYLAVSVTVGSALRGVIYKGERVFIVDAPNTNAVLNLIECVYLMRH